jgi:RNA polymerase sigma factor (sigma-70 family)
MLAVRPNPVLQFLRRLGVAERTAGLPDRDLLQCFVRQRDEVAFAALVRRHGPMVLRVCRQVLHQEEDAEDAFQATFLIFSRKAASVQKRDSLASWLYGVAHHAATDLKRSLARRRARKNEARPRSPDDPLAALTTREGLAILHQELARLPEKYRAPLVLCCLEGLARDEAARQLAWPLGKLKSRLEQARKVLGDRLIRRGLTLAGAFAAAMLDAKAAPAALPIGLLNRTVELATAAAGTVVLGTRVAALTEGVLTNMWLSKVKAGLVLILAASVVALGAGAAVLPGVGALAGGEGMKSAQPDSPRPVAGPSKRDEPKEAAKVSFSFGQLVQPRFFLRNTGEKDMQVAFPRLLTHSYYHALWFRDQDGQELVVRHRDDVPIPVGWIGTHLAPGKEAEIAGNLLSIGEGPDKDAVETVLKVKPDHAYSVQYTVPNYGDSKAVDLQTREFHFRVLAKKETDRKPPTTREQKAQIAWGKPGKNGLQVGVVLVPWKAAPDDTHREQ